MNGQQLKNSILQMAVQGKLVPQDPNDEPASVLLEKIRKEKERLIKEGKIKKEKNPSFIFRGADNLPYEKVGSNEPICIADEVPFEIPESWEWIRFSEIALFENGDRSSKYPVEADYVSEGIPFFGAKDMAEKYMSFKNIRFINKDKFAQLGNGKLQNGDLICLLRGNVGKTRIFKANEKFHTGFICAQMIIIRCLNLSILDYVYSVASSPYYMKIVETKITGTAVRQLPAREISRMLLPLPPLAEQKRIVAKIEELTPLIEKYSEKENDITRLNSNFPAQLKKSILQQAVQGKLVPQNPADEHASTLLQRIREEKKKLIAEGKIKKDKHESVIFRRDNSHYEIVGGVERCIDDEIPFEIPSSWEWVRLGSIGETAIGLTYKPNDKTDKENGTAVLRSNNIQNDKMNYDNLVYVSCNVPKRAIINKGEILICARNGSRALVGKAAIVNAEGMAFGAFMAKYTSMLSGTLNPYIMTFIESPVFRNQLDGVKTVTINQVTQDMLKLQLIPLPPLAEQYRIVKKLEEVLSTIKSIQV